jgi:hypothetical protein
MVERFLFYHGAPLRFYHSGSSKIGGEFRLQLNGANLKLDLFDLLFSQGVVDFSDDILF